MNNMEEQLWNYIDGFCTEEEQKAISRLIEQDENYRQKYAELMAFRENMKAIEPEEPAMGFTFKVMEAIRAEHASKTLKTYVDQRIVRGIAAFFICSILVLLGIVFANINWSAAVVVKLPEMKLPDVTNYFSPVVIKGFLFFDVVLGLFFFDQYFRKLFFDKKQR